MIVRAYAKLNLTLEVLDKREDGYRNIVSVFQSISLCDELTLAPSETLMLQGDLSGTTAEENLVMRAARLLQERMGEKRGAMMKLRKRIPVAAGMGGGSSDAAAALTGLCKLWGHQPSGEDLRHIAGTLGADVPFFLYGGTVLAEGRGDELTPLPPLRETWLVVATPPISIERKTATLYGALNPSHQSFGQRTQLLVHAIRGSHTLEAGLLYNTFEQVADEVFPGFAAFRRRMLDAGAATAHLSGSGPALFTLVDDEAAGARLQRQLGAAGIGSQLVKTIAKTYNQL